MLSLAEIALALRPFRVALSDEGLAAVQAYVSLLISWNRSINLTALEDPIEIVSRHFGESMLGASVVPMDSGRLADVGTGAGFPGLPLKIASPGLDITLIESNKKKCAFLAEVCSVLCLHGVTICNTAYEQFSSEQRFDFVCSRSLGRYRKMLRWARYVIRSPEGQVILWLGNEDSIIVSKTSGWRWNVPVLIPESKRRVLLVGRIE